MSFGSSVFGASTTAAPAGTSTFAGFGAQPQQPAQGTSPFGAQTGQQQPSTSPFGQPAGGAAQNAPGASFFGGTAQQQPQGTMGTSLFGGSTQQQPQGFPGMSQQSMSISPVQVAGPVLFSKSTKFNDLSDDVKRKFEALDAHVQGRVQISNELRQRKLGQEPTKGQELISEVHKEMLSVASMIQADAQFVKDLKTKTEQAVQDTIVATRIIDGFKNPQQHGTHLKNYASFPLEYFIRVTKEMQERFQWCKSTIERIERKLPSTVAQQQSTPQAIASTLQAQHGVFVSLAAKTAAVDAELQKLKSLYTQLWRTKTGSMRDPFNDLDRGASGDFGMETLQVK